MYFEVAAARPKPEAAVADDEAEVEAARLVLAPFSAPPLVSFDNIQLRQRATRILHISNPKTNAAQIFIQKFPEVDVEFSWTETTVNQNDSAVLEISWCPEKLISQRTTIQIAEKRKGKFDVIIIFKSVSNVKKPIKKTTRPLRVKKSPLKLPKPKSPKQRSTFKAGIRANTDYIKPNSTFRDFQIPSIPDLDSKISQFKIKEFELSPKFETITKFSSEEIIHHYYDVKICQEARRDTYLIGNNDKRNKENIWNNFTTPVKNKAKDSGRVLNDELSVLSAIENMEFTPIKTCDKNYSPKRSNMSSKNDGLKNNLPKRKFIFNSDDPDYSIFEIENNIENIPVNKIYNNKTHSVINLVDSSNISILDAVESKKIFTSNKNGLSNDKQKFAEKNSSPKIIVTHHVDDSLFRTPNNLFDNSVEYFNPHRCSTEIKMNALSPSLQLLNDEYIGEFANANPDLICNTTPNTTFKRLSSETYTKGDSPIIPIDPDNTENYLHSSPYSIDRSPLTSINQNCVKTSSVIFPANENIKNYNERALFRNNIRDKNNFSDARSVIEANLWQKSPLRPISPTPLFSIPEEPSMTTFDRTNEISNRAPFETFILNKTFDKTNTVPKPTVKNGWKKTAIIRNKINKPHSEHEVLSELEGDVENFKMNRHIDVYSAAATVNPFIETSVAYLYDEKAILKLEIEFKKWLNYLLTPPSDLDSKLDVDIGKTWIENRCKAVPLAPTREQVSSKYHTNHRLESLRKSANALISTHQLTQIYYKISNQVEKKILSIRTDKSLHVDIGLQKTILNILLCYNPLWLRIGLEAIHKKTISLSSNDDVCGLSEFIIDNVFRIPHITAKHILIQPTQVDVIKKNTLKKVLFLIYFLDQAKEKKIIFHDPCLFCRNAPFKESKQILFQFTKELLSGIGDITKHLRPTGYVLTHKQTYLHEFKYGVNNVAGELNDGIRLTRLMEIILMKENLTSGLRTPAISRLQKVHNVQIALTALANANFTIVGDISAKDIADGHREKTLSLLWQLINKFRAPLFEKSAILIQKWWRRNYLSICIRNRIAQKKVEKINAAAISIQSWWRGIKCRRDVVLKIETETKACITIQKNWRMWSTKRQYRQLKSSATIIQNRFRKYLMICHAKNALIELRNNRAAVVIQKWFRKCQLSNVMTYKNTDYDYYVVLRASVINIQRIYRANVLMKKSRNEFITIKTNVIKIQTFYRSVVTTRIVRKQYLELKSAAIIIQNRFRANKAMICCRNDFVKKYNSIIVIQRYYRNYVIARNAKNQYVNLLTKTIFIQRLYRAILKMRIERNKYCEMKKSAMLIQRCYRNYRHDRRVVAADKIKHWYRRIKMRQELALKNEDHASFVQLKIYTILIQRMYRAKLAMIKERHTFVTIKTSVVKIQKYYRSVILTRNVRQEYLALTAATISIQNRFRENRLMNQHRNEYIEKKNAAKIIQNYYRNYKLTIDTKNYYLKLKSTAVFIQRNYRSKLEIRKNVEEFRLLKSSAIIIQRYFRKYMHTKKTSAAVKIQRWYRKIKTNREFEMKNEDRKHYVKLKATTTFIQTKYRANVLMKQEKIRYNTIRCSVIKIQQFYRSVVITRTIRREFVVLRSTTVFIQNRIRAKNSMLTCKNDYLKTKRSAIVIQRYFRSYMMMKRIRNDYLRLQSTTVKMQTVYRAKLLMKIERKAYLEKLRSAVLIQRRFRTLVENKRNVAATTIQSWYRKIMTRRYLKLHNTDRGEFLKLKSSAKYIQTLYRANVAMKNDRNTYVKIKTSTIIIQRFYRNYILSKSIRNQYLQLRAATVLIQNKFRSNRASKLCRIEFLACKSAAITIQQYFRNYLTTIRIRHEYLTLRSAAISLQRIYRAKLSMTQERSAYQRQKNAAVYIQNVYRAYREMKLIRDEYVRKRNAAIVIQNNYKSYRQMIQYNSLKRACIIIQRYYRLILNRRKIKLEIEQERSMRIESALKIQSYWRGYNLRKKQKDDSKIKILRQRWQQGALESQQLTLAERNDDAIDVLSSFRDIASVIRAFKTLDFVTNVYPMMYSTDETAGQIARNLILYMGSTNRSVSALETLHLGTNILINMTRYHRTAHYVFSINHVSTILQLMMRWCDKDNMLSCSFSTLLWLFGKYDDMKKQLSEYLIKSDQYKILSHIRQSILRKKKMNIHKRNSNVGRISLTPVKNKTTLNHLLPFTEPDYGISRCRRPKIFQDELDAIDHVYTMYDIPLFEKFLT